MASCPTTEDRSLGLLLHCVRLGLIRHLEHALDKDGFGLNFTQFRILKILSQHASITPSELARALDHDGGALTRMLDRLQEKGYVRRKPRDDDRRIVDVGLTEAGRMLWIAIRATADHVSAFAVQDLDEPERELLFALLIRVRATLESSSPGKIA